MSLAFVFPGQGSQRVGMLAELSAEDAEVEAIFAIASEVLGYDLWALAQRGPAEILALTEITQPLMLAAGFATWRMWKKRYAAVPSWVAGHSLGEFTALVVAGVLNFSDAVDLVRVRGELMRDAVPTGIGGMAAVIGLSDDEMLETCLDANQGEVVEAVNFNAPGQVVIAGHIGALKRAMELAKTRGAKRALALPISVPCHSSMMRPAADALRARLLESRFNPPQIRFMSSVDSLEYVDPDAIRDLLYRQLASPVHWVATIRSLVVVGATQFVECGPGKVLTALNRRIERNPNLSFIALEDVEAFALVGEKL